jgi:hypothetical protein
MSLNFKKIAKSLIVVSLAAAAITSHFVQPEANGMISKIILMSLMTLGFLWPFTIIFSGRALFLAIRARRVSFKQVGLFILLLLLSPLALLAYFPPEGIFLFNPDIDTKYSLGYSETKFGQILSGMSEDQIIELLGQPLSRAERYDRDYDTLWSYTGDGACTWSDFAWKHRWVMMKNGKVVGTGAGWSFD